MDNLWKACGKFSKNACIDYWLWYNQTMTNKVSFGELWFKTHNETVPTYYARLTPEMRIVVLEKTGIDVSGDARRELTKKEEVLVH